MPRNFSNDFKWPKKTLNPHDLYSPEPRKENSYYSDADVFRARVISSKTFNAKYAPPPSQKNPLPDAYSIKPKPEASKSTSLKNNYLIRDYFSKKANLKKNFNLKQNERKNIPFPKPKLKPFYEYVFRRKDFNLHGPSLQLVTPTFDKRVIVLGPEDINERESISYLRVENGDFLLNLSYVKKSSHKFAIAMYKGKEAAITSLNNFVFRVKSDVMNKDFLELLIQDSKFDDKLAYIAFKFAQNNQISWEKFLDKLLLNIPSLKIQTQFIRERKAIDELIETKKSICKALDEWMKHYFYSLSRDISLQTKNFKELFSINEQSDSAIPKLKDLKNQYGKFIFSNLKDLRIQDCELCNSNFCKSDTLLLSRKVYGEESQNHLLNLWLGCIGFSRSYSLISLTPNKALGLPYSYWLLKENFNSLIKNIPSATAKRSISIIELRNCDFQIHTSEKINEFNKVCSAIFEYQKLIEEEIYKLNQLKEREKEIVFLKTFSKKINWLTSSSQMGSARTAYF